MYYNYYIRYYYQINLLKFNSKFIILLLFIDIDIGSGRGTVIEIKSILQKDSFDILRDEYIKKGKRKIILKGTKKKN